MMVMFLFFVNVFWLCIFSDTVCSTVLFSSTSPKFSPFSKVNIIYSTNTDVVSSFTTYLAPKYAWTEKTFIMADPIRKNGSNQYYFLDSDKMPMYVTPGHLVYWKYLGKEGKVFYILNDYLSMLCLNFSTFFIDLAVVDGAIHSTFDPSLIDHISHSADLSSMPPIPVYPFSYFINDSAASIVCLFSTMEINAEDRKWLLKDSERVDGTAIFLPLRAFQQLLNSSSLMKITSMTLNSPFSTSMDEIKQALGCYALSTFIYNQTPYKVLQTSYGLWFNDVGLENPFSFSSNNQESSYILLGDRSRRWILRYRDSSEYFSLSSQEMVDVFSVGTHFAIFDDGIPSIVKKHVFLSYSLGFCHEWSGKMKYFNNCMVKKTHYTDGSFRYLVKINGETFEVPTNLMLKYFTTKRRLFVDDEGVIHLTKNALPLLTDLGIEIVTVGVPLVDCNDLVMHKVEYAPLGDWHNKKSDKSNIERYCAFTKIRGCRFWIVKSDGKFIFISDKEMIMFSDVHRFFNTNIVIDSDSYLVINSVQILSSFLSRFSYRILDRLY